MDYLRRLDLPRRDADYRGVRLDGVKHNRLAPIVTLSAIRTGPNTLLPVPSTTLFPTSGRSVGSNPMSSSFAPNSLW